MLYRTFEREAAAAEADAAAKEARAKSTKEFLDLSGARREAPASAEVAQMWADFDREDAAAKLARSEANRLRDKAANARVIIAGQGINVPATSTASPSGSAGATGATPAKPCPVAVTADQIARHANEFQQCLGFKGWKDFELSDLSVQIAAKIVDTRAELVPSITFRWGPPQAAESGRMYRTSYLKVKGGVLAQLGDDGKTADFADLSETGHASGYGYVVGLEWGRSRLKFFDDPNDKNGYVDDVQTGLKEAQSDCITASAAEVIPDAAASGGKRLRTEQELIAFCEDQSFVTWMSNKKRRAKYYGSLVQPIWGAKADAALYAGIDWRWRRPEYAYFPLKDPANTGVPIVTTIPAEATKQKEEVWTLRGYVGTHALSWLDLSASLSYRRDFQWAKGTRDKQVCAITGAAYTTCDKANIAPPFELRGWVGGLRAAVEIPRVGFLPKTAFEVKLTRDFETHQTGIQIPYYFVPDEKGVPNAGVMLGCTTKARAPYDQLLPNDCKVSVFLSTAFSFDGRP